MEFKPKNYIFEKEYPLSKEIIWNLLSDTNRVNLYIGLFPARFSSVRKRENGSLYRLATGRAKGFLPISWEDNPFEWEKERISSVGRLYLKGPIKHYRGTVELIEIEDSLNTKVRLTAEFSPRNLAGFLAIPIVAYQSIQKKFEYLDQYILSGAQTFSSLPQKKIKHKVNASELERLLSKLKTYPVKEEHVELLRVFLVEESVQDVGQIEPLKIAERWKIDSDEALQLFLYATKTGLLNLSWNVMCPNCRVSKVEHASLSELQTQFHCDLCGVNYDADFDQYVELTFSVHTVIRQAYAEVYCLGGPSITPHILAQKVVAKGDALALMIPGDEKNIQLRILQANAVVPFISDGNSVAEASITYSDAGWSQSDLPICSQVKIENTSSQDLLLVLEQGRYKKKAVTAAQVTTMQEFRDLFSSEVLSPGQKIDINHVTILFTDLKESTSLYETAGDASAFGQVRDHFDFITGIVRRNSGSIVKTIGDSVMAVFHLPVDGLKAALEIQQGLPAYNNGKQGNLVLKAGLFSGPAIVVNSNNQLDYFGRTVNIAARIQGQSIGNDIVISRKTLEHPESARLLSENRIAIEAFSIELRGVEENMELVRIHIKEGMKVRKLMG